MPAQHSTHIPEIIPVQSLEFGLAICAGGRGGIQSPRAK